MITQTNFQGPDSDPADIKNEMSPQTNLHAPSFEEEDFDIHQVSLPVTALGPEDEKAGLQQMMAQYGQQPAGYVEYYEGGGQQQWLGEYQSHQLSYNYNQSYGQQQQQQQQQQQHYYSQQQQQAYGQHAMYPGGREELYPGLPPGRSPSGSHSTPSPHSQGQEGGQEGGDQHQHHQFTELKRPHADAFRHESMSHSQNIVRKPKVSRRKKKRDPNEPQKPVSAYALFFRDSQASIKGRNPNMSFGDVSKCVASLWDALDPDSKAMYKKRTEMAKKEYLRQLASYRATLVSNGQGDEIYGFPGYGYPSLGLGQSIPPHPPGPPVLPHQAYMQGSPPGFQLNHQAGGPGCARPDISPEAGLPPSPPSAPPGPGHPDTEFPGQTFPPHHDRNHNSPCYHRVPGQCGRPGCSNPVTKASDGTESTYCSSECVVGQCREVYTSWSSHHQPGGRELPGQQPRPAQVK